MARITENEKAAGRQRNSPLRNYSFLWVTLVLFLGSLIGHWVFAWFAYVSDQESHRQTIEITGFIVQTMRDTLENWQSEFLQLIWQVAGLAFLLHLGSPQSKEGDDRKEEKLDYLIKQIDPEKGEQFISKLDKKFPKE